MEYLYEELIPVGKYFLDWREPSGKLTRQMASNNYKFNACPSNWISFYTTNRSNLAIENNDWIDFLSRQEKLKRRK